ncbi:MAG: hypothetical protein V3V16_07430 [Melioribacteraceae bacterium]
MLLPIGTSLTCWIKKIKLSFELKLFAIYIWVTFILQAFALVLSYGFGLQNLFLFRLHYPFHIAIFTYLLLKWLHVKNKNIILLVGLSILISVLGDFLFGERNAPLTFMLWFDVIVLFSMSFLLSFVNDKKKIHLPKEYNFIHIGIYLYSTITLIGLFPSSVGLETYGFFLQSIAVIISNYFFARSFLCLFPSRG